MGCRLRGRMVRTVAVAALLSVAPACSATAGGNTWGSGQPSGSLVRRAFRPLFEPQRTKPFYLSGYAGATYGPGPGMRVFPSMYRQAAGHGACATCPHTVPPR